MRVLICTFTYPPNRDGVAVAAAAMADGLEHFGHEVSIATAPVASRGLRPEGRVAPVYEFAGESPDLTRRLLEVARFQTWVEEKKFDIVVCHCWYSWLAEALDQMTPVRKPPVVLVSHGYSAHVVDWSPRLGWGLGSWLRALPRVWRLPRALREYAWVTFLSGTPDLRRFFDVQIARWTGFKRFSVIANGTYPERFAVDGAPFRQVYGLGNSFLILCVANYSARKNQKMAVRAFFRAKLEGAVLVFIGSEYGAYGRMVQSLVAQGSARGSVGRVVLLENVSQELTVAAFAACDVFLLSAKEETQPIVLIEAMAAKKPWISTDTGGVRELPGGIVVAGESGLAGGLRKLADNHTLRDQLGLEGWNGSQTKYNWTTSMAAYDNLLRRLASEVRHAAKRPS